MAGLENIPWWGLVLLGLLSIVQLWLQVWALVALLQANESRLRLIKNRWVWLVLILLTNGIGAIVFLAAGRAPATVDIAPPPPGADPVRRAVALLYGDAPASSGGHPPVQPSPIEPLPEHLAADPGGPQASQPPRRALEEA